jgi:SAM-dependent methyltransferase
VPYSRSARDAVIGKLRSRRGTHKRSPSQRFSCPSTRFWNRAKHPVDDFVAEAPGYLSSQYYPNVPARESVNGVRCENLEKLSFDDHRTFSSISFDLAAAFREIARTLRPGGAHVFTTPLENKEAATEICARRTPDGQVVQLIEPAQYHGNPVSSEGSLLTVRWGYDITPVYLRCHRAHDRTRSPG